MLLGHCSLQVQVRYFEKVAPNVQLKKLYIGELDVEAEKSVKNSRFALLKTLKVGPVRFLASCMLSMHADRGRVAVIPARQAVPKKLPALATHCHPLQEGPALPTMPR